MNENMRIENLNQFKRAATSGWVLAILAGLFYLLLSSTRLDGQGLYYDEAHQATAAFAYVGEPVFQFAALKVNGLPLMNMPYSGAIKTGLYGVYLRLSGRPFEVVSWRLTGILLVTSGLVLFGLILRKRFPLSGMVVFTFFLLTDVTFILTTRHDWGPVALGAFFRLMLMAVWLRGELSEETRARSSFWLGSLVGISIFEKLSSVVLLIALFVMLFGSPRRRNLRHVLAAIGGGIFGGIPLIFANLSSYFSSGTLISFQFQSTQSALSVGGFFHYLVEAVSLGAGSVAMNFILGHGQMPYAEVIEASLMAVILLGLVFSMARSSCSSALLRSARIMLLAYAGILAAFYFFPQPTWIHHWIVGSPFQYAALGLFVAAARKGEVRWNGNVFRQMGFGLLVLFCFFRAGGMFALEQSLLRGDASEKWDPSLTRMGQFAGQNVDKALFFAGDWGVANQMICFTNGNPEVVYERDWTSTDVKDILGVALNSHRKEIYLVFPKPIYFATPETRAVIIDEVTQGLSPDWQVEPPEDVLLRNLSSVSVVRYKKVR